MCFSDANFFIHCNEIKESNQRKLVRHHTDLYTILTRLSILKSSLFLPLTCLVMYASCGLGCSACTGYLFWATLRRVTLVPVCCRGRGFIDDGTRIKALPVTCTYWWTFSLSSTRQRRKPKRCRIASWKRNSRWAYVSSRNSTV